MQSRYRLKKNYQYNYVYKHAKSAVDNNFVLLYCPCGGKQTKIGFSVSKKFGHAVARNRIRRQMKAAFSQVLANVKNGYNIILIPRKREQYVFSEVSESVKYLLNKAGLWQ